MIGGLSGGLGLEFQFMTGDNFKDEEALTITSTVLGVAAAVLDTSSILTVNGLIKMRNESKLGQLETRYYQGIRYEKTNPYKGIKAYIPHGVFMSNI